MTKCFYKTLCTAIAIVTCILSAIVSQAQIAPVKATQKIAPSEIQQSAARQQKNNIWNQPPNLSTKSKALNSRPNVIKYHEPAQKAPTPTRITAADGSYIYGCMIYNSTWTEDNQPVGMYKFGFGDASSLQAVEGAIGDDYIATGGGVYANGKFYFVSYYSLMGYYIADLNVCDFETWKIEESIPTDAGSVARDMTYDPVTGNVYGCFINDDMDGWVFGRLNLETGERTYLSDLELVFVTIAANSKGEIYGIDLRGDLYKFNKDNGSKTKIGNTGHTPAYNASGCFDLRTDKFYWECLESDAVANIYEVNTDDASVTLSTTLANSAELVSMFIPVPEANDDAPAMVSNFDAAFANESLSGNITFTIPTSTYAGKSLSGAISYELTINEKVYSTGTANAGANITIPVSVSSAGEYRFAVTVSNSAGKSPIATIAKWIGYDVPNTVSGLKLAKGANAGDIVLSWNPVTTTVHNGYIDTDNVTYRIIRQPGNVEVATSHTQTTFAETLPADAALATYSYDVYAINNDKAGAAATSNKLSIGVAALPFVENFETVGIDRFYVVDANNDGFTWTFDGIWNAARYRYSSYNNYTTPADDWLFSPMFKIENDRLYYFEFTSHCYASDLTERMEIKAGKDQAVSAMTKEIYPVTAITDVTATSRSKYIKFDASDTYSFGFHACSAADKMVLKTTNRLSSLTLAIGR